MVAVVAAEAIVAAVEGKADRATGAFEAVAAVSADHEGGVGSAVEEEDGLLALLEGFFEILMEAVGEDSAFLLLIDDLEVFDKDFGEFCFDSGALGEVEAGEKALFGLFEAFDAGGGGAEDEGAG